MKKPIVIRLPFPSVKPSGYQYKCILGLYIASPAFASISKLYKSCIYGLIGPLLLGLYEPFFPGLYGPCDNAYPLTAVDDLHKFPARVGIERLYHRSLLLVDYP